MSAAHTVGFLFIVLWKAPSFGDLDMIIPLRNFSHQNLPIVKLLLRSKVHSLLMAWILYWHCYWSFELLVHDIFSDHENLQCLGLTFPMNNETVLWRGYSTNNTNSAPPCGVSLYFHSAVTWHQERKWPVPSQSLEFNLNLKILFYWLFSERANHVWLHIALAYIVQRVH